MSGPMNPWQAAVAKGYADGDFAHFASDPRWRENLRGCGDTLFAFLMIELATEEDCETAQDAVDRLFLARGYVDRAIDNVITACGDTVIDPA